MSLRSHVARALVALFVAAVMLVAGPAAPASADNIPDGQDFLECGDPSADGENCLESLSVAGVGALDPDDDTGLNLQVFFAGGMLQIQLVNWTTATLASAEPDEYELDLTTSDVVTMEIEVGNSFTPIMVGGAGILDDWTWDAGTRILTIVASPENGAFDTGADCGAEDFEEGGSCSIADFDFEPMMLLGAADALTRAELDAQGVPAEFQGDILDFFTDYTGGWVATDAQTFTPPQMDPETQAVEFSLSAPHLTTTGDQNVGFFEMMLPRAVIESWGLTFDQDDPPDLGATADGASVTLQTPVYVAARGTFQEGWLIRSNPISYSSPDIAVSPFISSAVEEDEPEELDLSRAGTTPATTRLPVRLPESGEVTRQVTLQGAGATLVLPKGTKVTVGGEPFTGTIDPPKRVHGAAGGLRNAVSLTATSLASASSVSALAEESADVVFDPPITITLTAPQDLADTMRVVRIAPDGTITDAAGTATSKGVQVEATGPGTYGLASELDLSTIESAPSIAVAMPIALPDDGVIDFPTTLNGDGAAIAFEAGTAVTASKTGTAFDGTIEPPAEATAPSGVGSAVKVATGAGTAVAFDPAATLTLTPPDGTAADEVGAVRVTSASSTSCLASTLSDDAAAVELSVAQTGSYGLALPVTATVAEVARAWSKSSGLHSQWSGQSAPVSLCPGQVAELAVRLRNTGSETWRLGTASQVLLGTNAPPGNTVAIDSGLVVDPLYGSRLATHDETSIGPGAVGTFRFKVRAPETAGSYRIDVRPVVEGVSWLEDEGMFLSITVR